MHMNMGRLIYYIMGNSHARLEKYSFLCYCINITLWQVKSHSDPMRHEASPALRSYNTTTILGIKIYKFIMYI